MADRPGIDPGKLMARLRDERIAQGLTVEWIADRVGVSQPTISQYESGKKRPGIAKLRKWLRALKLPEKWADPWAEYQISKRVEDMLPPTVPAEDRRFVRRLVAGVLAEHRDGDR